VRVIIADSPAAVAQTAANFIAQQIAHNNHSILGLATGSTPIALYQELTRRYVNGGLSFKGCVSFNLDEYIGIPADHAQSYRTFMQAHLFDAIDIAAHNTHLPEGNGKDNDVAAAAYEQLITDHGRQQPFFHSP